jgi:lysozyme family protein
MFESCVNIVLQKEGGFVNHSADPGGATNYGITIKVLSEYRKTKVSVEDVQRLSIGEAKQIYFKNYWKPIQGDQLPIGVNLSVFDFAVNAGVSRAAKTLQKIVNVQQDGIIGLVTLKAVQTFDVEDMIERLADERVLFYRSLKTFSVFGKGWLRRTDLIKIASLEMLK